MSAPRRLALWLLLAAIALSLAGGLHNLLLAAKYDLSLWDGVCFHYQADEYHKMSEVQAARDGYLMVGNPFLYEERYGPATNTPFGPALMALFLKAIRLDVPTATWLLDFIVPILVLFFTLYYFGRLFEDHPRAYRLAAAFLFILVFLMAPTQRTMMRFMQSQSTILVFLFLYFETMLLQKDRVGPLEFAALLVVNGAGPVLDVWYALIITATQCGLVVWNFARGRRDLALRFAMLVAAVLIGGAPEFVRIMSLSRTEGWPLLSARLGNFRTFLPSYPTFLLWMAILAIVLAAARRLRILPSSPILTCTLISLLVCLGLYFQNLVTFNRLYFQGEHVAGKALLPVGVLSAGMLLEIFRRWSGRSAVILGVIVPLALAHHFYEIRRPLALTAPVDAFHEIYGYDAMKIQHDYHSAFLFLKDRTPASAVVLADPVLDMIMRVAARKFTYCAQIAVFTSFDQEALRTRYYPFLWMRKTLRTETPFDPTWRMHEHLKNYNARDFGVVYSSLGTALPHQVRVNNALARLGLQPIFDVQKTTREFQGYIDALYDGYESFTDSRTISGVRDLLPYRCDYVLWGPQERRFYPDYNPAGDTTLERVFEDAAAGTEIYAFKTM